MDTTEETAMVPIEPEHVEETPGRTIQSADQRKRRVYSRAAVTGLLFALIGVVAHVLLDAAVVTWAGSFEAYVQVVGIVTPFIGFIFSMIGLGQRKYAGQAFAVLGLLLSVAGLIAAQYFWTYVIAGVATGTW